MKRQKLWLPVLHRIIMGTTFFLLSWLDVIVFVGFIVKTLNVLT